MGNVFADRVCARWGQYYPRVARRERKRRFLVSVHQVCENAPRGQEHAYEDCADAAAEYEATEEIGHVRPVD